MIRFAYALLLLLVVPLTAQELPDLSASIQGDSSDLITGTRTGGTLTVRNHSSIATPQPVTASVTLEPRQQEITISGPAGWSCGVASDGAIAQCWTESLAANAEATFRYDFLGRNDIPAPSVSAYGHAYQSDQDPNPINNLSQTTLFPRPHSATAALSVHAATSQGPVPAGTPAAVTIDVRNTGPAAATRVRVDLGPIGVHVTSVAGAGWTCTSFTRCTRASLGAGESAPITVTYVVPYDTVIVLRALAGAEDSFDPNGSDNETSANVVIGDAAQWKRVLLPVVMRNMPGLNGSIWETDITALIESDSFDLFPRACVRTQCFVQVPLRRPFRPSDYGVAGPSAKPATFLYSRAEQSDRVKYNLRVRDLTRTSETWGTEVPAVREEEFRTTPILLMPLPVDPLFRTTVRIYDFDAREGAQVTVHVYADQETEPRATLVRTFTTWPEKVTTASLPVYPGYIQLDLGEAGAALAGAETAWIRIEPRSEGLKFWAFASVTNNPTGHVTTVTPQ